MSEIRPIREIDAELSKSILPGLNVPHSASAPLVRMHDGAPVLAEFLFTYTGADISAEEIPRPSHWAVADLVTGQLLARFDCREQDFSDAEPGSRYSIHFEPDRVFDDAYVAESFGILDAVRQQYAEGQPLNKELYAEYFARVIASMPPAYRVFYEDLGSPEAL